MRNFFAALLGKTVRQVARLKGGGSALPGLVIEKLDPDFMARALRQLPLGVVVVSGTNGKTTTTKMVVEMLQAAGLKVFTNRTGSNFARGVIAAIIRECSINGKLAADIAVLELDEAHAMHFIRRVPPRYTLLLNVLRDQLDRFGEIDTTARYLQRIADATTVGLVTNSADRLVREIGERTRARAAANGGKPLVREFGLSPELAKLFPSDEDFHTVSQHPAETGEKRAAASTAPEKTAEPAVQLLALGEHEATFQLRGKSYQTTLQLEGLYNTYNAAAALALVTLLQDCEAAAADAAGPAQQKLAAVTSAAWLSALSQVRPAFGRGERLTLDGQPLDLVLVKNPAGFRLGLSSFQHIPADIMIAINDQYADGRDMSWLWDVDFTVLQEPGVQVVSGIRAWDMALRLEHDDVPFQKVEENIQAAIAAFRAQTGGARASRPRRIYCTYTAMLEIRKHLASLTEVEDVWQ